MLGSLHFLLLSVSVLTQFRDQPRRQCCPPSEWTFPSQLTQLRKFLTDAHVQSNQDNPSQSLFFLVILDCEDEEHRHDSTISRSIIHFLLSSSICQILGTLTPARSVQLQCATTQLPSRFHIHKWDRIWR